MAAIVKRVIAKACSEISALIESDEHFYTGEGIDSLTNIIIKVDSLSNYGIEDIDFDTINDNVTYHVNTLYFKDMELNFDAQDMATLLLATQDNAEIRIVKHKDTAEGDGEKRLSFVNLSSVKSDIELDGYEVTILKIAESDSTVELEEFFKRLKNCKVIIHSLNKCIKLNSENNVEQHIYRVKVPSISQYLKLINLQADNLHISEIALEIEYNFGSVREEERRLEEDLNLLSSHRYKNADITYTCIINKHTPHTTNIKHYEELYKDAGIFLSGKIKEETEK